uniref:LOB domain-containing protein n=1 Tax=Kalanchoe fedtschenkoi TaxID=63787 RepID=A0A7N0T514_KALFE
MSCNGCRVLRKGCSETCVLRPCLQWIDSPESQGHATVFVAKFFGRAGLMSFISNVPESQRPALFQSLLFEACGRTVNPVNGAVGLLGTGNWQVCQAAVETVLRGGTLRPVSADLLVSGRGAPPQPQEADECSEEATCSNMWSASASRKRATKKSNVTGGGGGGGGVRVSPPGSAELGLSLSPGYEQRSEKRRRPGTPSEESGTSFERGLNGHFEVEGQFEQQRRSSEARLLELFR